MADNIVESLFGPSPLALQMQLNSAAQQQAQQYANMTPMQRGSMSLFQAGQGLGGMFGGTHPVVQQAQQQQQALSGLDMSNPQSILAKAQVTTDPRLRIQLQLLAQQAVERQQVAALKAAQTLAELKKATTEASPIAKLNPKDYTPESWAAYIKSGSTADLRALDTKGVWGDLYQVGGATVQKNSVTGEVRTAVTRPPVSHITLNGAGALTTDAAETAINMALAGDPSMMTGWGRSPKDKATIMNVLTQMVKEKKVTPTDFAMAKAMMSGAMQGFRTSAVITANSQIAANEATQMMNVVRSVAPAVNLTDYPSLNKLKNAVDKQIGGPAVPKLYASLNALINTYARATNPRGVPTIHDKEKAETMINEAMSNGQLEGVMQVMTAEMEAALAAPAATRENLKQLMPGQRPVAAASSSAAPQSAVSQIPTEQPKAAGAPPSLDAYLKSKGY